MKYPNSGFVVKLVNGGVRFGMGASKNWSDLGSGIILHFCESAQLKKNKMVDTVEWNHVRN